MKDSFGYAQVGTPPITYDGFERLNAELLIMLGDESYTKAFQSRFDLAGSSLTSFEGSLFEPGGIDLSGVAGFELYTLYRSVQYYRMVLDRFYVLSAYMWNALQFSSGTDRNFVTQRTVLAYLDRVLRASTQAARASSEIAQRYQALNRPDLARYVTQRAYTSAYLESLIVGRMMQRIADLAEASEKPEVHAAIEKSATVYKMALLDMCRRSSKTAEILAA